MSQNSRNDSIWVFNAGMNFAGNPKWLFAYIQYKRPDIQAHWLCDDDQTIALVRRQGWSAHRYDSPAARRIMRQAGVYVVENYLVSGIGAWVALLVAVIITAGFIPTMLGKGSLDLVVSKPVGRPRLLLYKYLGGLTFILLLTAYAAAGVWVAIGVRTGIWAPNFLLVIPILTFYFAVLYSVSTLAAG